MIFLEEESCRSKILGGKMGNESQFVFIVLGKLKKNGRFKNK